MAKKHADSKIAKAPKGTNAPITAHADGAPGINIGLSGGDRRTISDGLAHFLSDAFRFVRIGPYFRRRPLFPTV